MGRGLELRVVEPVEWASQELFKRDRVEWPPRLASRLHHVDGCFDAVPHELGKLPPIRPVGPHRAEVEEECLPDHRPEPPVDWPAQSRSDVERDLDENHGIASMRCPHVAAFGEPERNPLVGGVLAGRGLSFDGTAGDPALLALSPPGFDAAPWCIAVAVTRPETAAGLRMEMALRQTSTWTLFDGGTVVRGSAMPLRV